MMRAAVESMIKAAGVRAAFGALPEDVEACRRAGPRGDVFVLINYGRQTRTVALPRPMRDVLAAGPPRTSVELARYGVALLQPAN